MSWFKSNVLETDKGIEIVTFADGTDEQIAAMLQAHYNGEIDVSDYWSVGDQRLIHINAMGATGVGESHAANDYHYTIIDFKHDDLTTSIGSVNKAAVTLQQEELFYTGNTVETGYMNSSRTNAGGWSSCARRAWCNNIYFNALPQYIQDNIKIVNKLTSAGSQSSTIITSTDKAFLPSEIEIFGSVVNSYSGEGTQYSYYITSSNKNKNSYSGSGCGDWWTRSPEGSGTTTFCNEAYSNAASISRADAARGLAPAFCL